MALRVDVMSEILELNSWCCMGAIVARCLHYFIEPRLQVIIPVQLKRNGKKHRGGDRTVAKLRLQLQFSHREIHDGKFDFAAR